MNLGKSWTANFKTDELQRNRSRSVLNVLPAHRITIYTIFVSTLSTSQTFNGGVQTIRSTSVRSSYFFCRPGNDGGQRRHRQNVTNDVSIHSRDLIILWNSILATTKIHFSWVPRLLNPETRLVMSHKSLTLIWGRPGWFTWTLLKPAWMLSSSLYTGSMELKHFTSSSLRKSIIITCWKRMVSSVLNNAKSFVFIDLFKKGQLFFYFKVQCQIIEALMTC